MPQAALWQGARGAATAHRVRESFSQVVVSTCPSEYRWVVHCTQSPTCSHGRSAPPGFCKRGANPAWTRLQAPISLIFLMLVPGTSGAWRPGSQRLGASGVGGPPLLWGCSPLAPPLCAADPQGYLHLPHVPSRIRAVSGRRAVASTDPASGRQVIRTIRHTSGWTTRHPARSWMMSAALWAQDYT
jgi:hypothetical protein